MAVPVSWQTGSWPLAAITEFLSRVRATKRSLSVASGSVRIFATDSWWLARR
jgi:hypothetical protein